MRTAARQVRRPSDKASLATTRNQGHRMRDTQPEYPPVWLRVPEMGTPVRAVKHAGTSRNADSERPQGVAPRKIHGWTVLAGAALGVAVYWILPGGPAPAPVPDRPAPPRWKPSDVQWRLPEGPTQTPGLATQDPSAESLPGSAAVPESEDQARYGPAEEGPALRRGVPPAYARPPTSGSSPSADASQPGAEASPGPVATLGKIGPARAPTRRDHRTIY